jgi:N-acetylglucosamine-6-sulfatase
MRNALIGLLLVLLSLAAPRAEAQVRTVVVVVTDDEDASWNMLRAMPHLRDDVAARGVSFSEAHAQSTLCCPARGGILTGLWVHHHGLVRNDPSLLVPGETIATAARRIGFETGLFGKYLNLAVEQLGCKAIPGWSKLYESKTTGKHLPPLDFCKGGGAPYGVVVEKTGYAADLIFDHAAAWIRSRPASTPLLVYIAPPEPHRPLDSPPRYAKLVCGLGYARPPAYDLADVTNMPSYVRRLPRIGGQGVALDPYCGMMRAVDDGIGDVLAALEDTGRLADSLIVYTADQGMNSGRQRLLGGKQTPYATDVPLYLRCDSCGLAGASTSMLAQSTDLAPTIADAIGATLGPYPTGQAAPDGASLLPALRGEPWTRDHVFEEWLADTGEPAALPVWVAERYASTSPIGGWRCIHYASGEAELYHLDVDPGETHNLIDVRTGTPLTPEAWAAAPVCFAQLEADRTA